MSSVPQGPGWWQASDGRWYPPQPPTFPPVAPQYQPPVPGGYQVYQGGYGGPSGLPSVQGYAVASLVLGIVGLVGCLCWIVGVVFAIAGLPFGIIALRRINRGEADPAPKGLAIAGIACSTIALVLGVVMLVLFVASSSSTTY